MTTAKFRKKNSLIVFSLQQSEYEKPFWGCFSLNSSSRFSFFQVYRVKRVKYFGQSSYCWEPKPCLEQIFPFSLFWGLILLLINLSMGCCLSVSYQQLMYILVWPHFCQHGSLHAPCLNYVYPQSCVAYCCHFFILWFQSMLMFLGGWIFPFFMGSKCKWTFYMGRSKEMTGVLGAESNTACWERRKKPDHDSVPPPPPPCLKDERHRGILGGLGECNPAFNPKLEKPLCPSSNSCSITLTFLHRKLPGNSHLEDWEHNPPGMKDLIRK